MRPKRNLAPDRVEIRVPISDQFAGHIKIRVQKFATFAPLAPLLSPEPTDRCGINFIQKTWTYV